MAIKARDQVTIAVGVDVASVDIYYKLQLSTATPPIKPSTANPSGWSTTEPTYDSESTNTLYTCQKTTLTDGTFYWSSVSKSTSYEAAKTAWNLANSASTAVANSVISKSSSGERTIVTEDAAELPLITLTAYGESVQENTPTPDAPTAIKCLRGKNLFNISGHYISEKIAREFGKNDTMTGPVSDTRSWNYNSSEFKLDLGPGQYTAVLEVLGEGTSNNAAARICKSVGSTESEIGAFGKDDVNLIGIKYRTFTLDKAAHIGVLFKLYDAIVRFSILSGNYVHKFGPKDYLGYGEIRVKSIGKNLLNLPTWDEVVRCESSSSYRNYPIVLEPNTTYHLNTIWSNAAISNQCGYILIATDVGNGSWKAIAHSSASPSNANITTGADGMLYLNVYASQTQYETMLENAKPQLEKGTLATEYEPYKGSVTCINLKGNDLQGLDGTYLDVLSIYANGQAVLTKMCGRKKLSQQEDAVRYAASVFYVKFSDMLGHDVMSGSTHNNTHPLLSTAFVHTTGTANVWSGGSAGMFTRHAVAAYPQWDHCVFFKTPVDYSNVGAFLEVYGDVEVVYPLDEMRTIALGTVDLPDVSDNSIVSIDAEIQPIIDGSWWTKAGSSVGSLAQRTKEAQGNSEAPYTEVEWVESNGKQYVYLDWKPPIATWGFEADFIIRNAFSTTVGAWNAATNKNGYGNVFGTRNTSAVNDVQFGSYSTNGTLRWGNNGYATAGLFKKDQTRQQVSLKGTSLKRGDGTTVTVTRSTEDTSKPYANMAVFGLHEGLRRGGVGYITQPGTVRIYSLKFYENTTLKVDLIGAIRKSDGTTGLYDKIAGHFFPAPGMTYGSEVGDLGTPDTLERRIAKDNPSLSINNLTDRRMWRANAPMIDQLEDGQQITVTPEYTVVNSVQTTNLPGWDDTTSNGNVYLKLTLADGSDTDWIPCWYGPTTRLTTHYGAGIPVRFAYRENATGNSTDTATNPVLRGWFADANYADGNTTYTKYSDYVIAGKNGLRRYTLCMRDDEGNWTSIVNEANNVNATGKTCYTGGLLLGGVGYHSTGGEYVAGADAGTIWESHGGIDFRYSVNGVTNAAATTTLQLRKPIYLVGTIGTNDSLFYLDTTKWWTQEPNDSSKVYVLVGTAYSSYYAIFIATVNPAYVVRDGDLVEITDSRFVDVNAELVRQADSIALKANAANVYTKESTNALLEVKANKETLTSEINASADTVKIDASRVNIEGAAIFTSGRLTDANIAKTSNSIPDTRSTNQPPSWYFTNYPKRSITEFKQCSVLGLSGEIYCYLTTVTGWTDSSGGYPKQTAQVGSKFYYRTGISNNAWGDWSDTESTVNEAYDKITSRGEQLIVNGNGFLGDNTNFSMLTFDGSVANGSPGSFTRASTVYAEVYSDEFFPVDPSKNYKVEFDVISKGTGSASKMYGMFLFYDVDKLSMNVLMCSYIVGSTTTLARELKNGDTKVYLTDASGFIDTNNAHQRALIFWDYTNSFGYTYPPETYSRNYVQATGGLWSDYSKIDKTNNVITLTSAWTAGTHAAGTSVSQNSSGSTYAYYWSNTAMASDEWIHVSRVYNGYQHAGISNQSCKFYRGTAYCKLGWLWNYQGSASDPQKQLWVTNILVKEDVATSEELATTTANAVKRTQRIYYRKNSAGAPSTPGTASANWVTNGNSGTWTKYNAWSTRVPPIADSVSSSTKYLYLYTCEQREMGNGTVAYTTVLLDDSTTVIDGGNIITGSVSANAVNASSGTFDVANIPVLNSSKINVDSITQIGPSNGNHVVIDSGSFDFVNNTTDVATLELLNSDSDDVQVNLRLDGGFGNNFLSAYTGQVVHDTSSDTTRLTSSLAAHYYGTPSASDGQLNLSSMSVRSGAYLSDVYMQTRDITVVPIKQPPLTVYNASLDNLGHLISCRAYLAGGDITIPANGGASATWPWQGSYIAGTGGNTAVSFPDTNYIVVIGKSGNGQINGFDKVDFMVTGKTESQVTIAGWNSYSQAVTIHVVCIGFNSRYGSRA